jgi:hypothetical protein
MFFKKLSGLEKLFILTSLCKLWTLLCSMSIKMKIIAIETFIIEKKI